MTTPLAETPTQIDAALQQFAAFPDTRYMGSKRRVIAWLNEALSGVRITRALDAFSGSACVSYLLKSRGYSVTTNDFLHLAYHTAHATVQNSATRLSPSDIGFLLATPRQRSTFIRDTYGGLYFEPDDCTFLDNLRSRIAELPSPLKRSLALTAATRSCMKRRPRGIFTFVGRKGFDGRKDLTLSLRDHFVRAVSEINSAVFSNGNSNRACLSDIFDLDPTNHDTVYLDPPYLVPHSDADYTRRYHFVEGFCRAWKGIDIDHNTVTKKFKSYPTAFSSHRNAVDSFDRLFSHFRNQQIILSYSSNSTPSKVELVALLKRYKARVTVLASKLTYSHGTHAHRVGSNRNRVSEYLFIAK